MDISVNIAHTPFKSKTCFVEIQMEGSVSQNFHLGPSFDFNKCRDFEFKK